MQCNCKTKAGKRTQRSMLSAIVPAIVLVLLPKCPLCIVAYAACVGVGLSVSTAAMLRGAIISICGVALVALVARAAKRGYRTRRMHDREIDI
ncbi:MAG: hypothetical protein JWO36_3600 [Myxococcales bacterium]|nr:hypothetical protein [Myxococcales bacterium]